MPLRPRATILGQFMRISFVLFLVIHVLISAWLVVQFDGEYTEGSPAPTEVSAFVAIDKDETLIDVKMEKATSFILYMMFRDYEEPEQQMSEKDNQQDDDAKNDDQDNSNSNDEPIEWLKIGRNTTFLCLSLVVLLELLVMTNIRFMTVIRIITWLALIASFAIVMPATYVIDLAGEDEQEKDNSSDEEDFDTSLASETFVESTESGAIAHEKSEVNRQFISYGMRFNMEYSGYDLGLVDPEDYAEVRSEVPDENSSFADSFIKFESTLDVKYGKNLPTILLIPISWFFFPALSINNRNRNDKRYQIKPLTDSDLEQMWLINEQGLPGTGKVSIDELSKLLQLSELSIGAYEDDSLVGFVICLLPNSEYSSLNYAWFNQRYEDFIYVDRIAVEQGNRNNGIGSLLYQKVFTYSQQHKIPTTAEVSLKPPNPGSDRFHLRHGFTVVGELASVEKAVTMYLRD